MRLGEGAALALGLGAEAYVFAPELVHAQQVLNREHQLGVVPGLLEVVRGSLFHQLDRGFQRSPRGHQEHRQIGIDPTKLAKQRDAFLAGSRVIAEVHVLDHDPDVVAGHQTQRLLRAVRAQGLDAVNLKEHLERGSHRALVIDDQNLGHRL